MIGLLGFREGVLTMAISIDGSSFGTLEHFWALCQLTRRRLGSSSRGLPFQGMAGLLLRNFRDYIGSVQQQGAHKDSSTMMLINSSLHLIAVH